MSYSARVVMMQTNAAFNTLAAIEGEPFIGPDLGEPDTLHVEAEAAYAGDPTTADLAALSAIGTITSVFTIGDHHSVFLQVPVREIGRLDHVPNTLSIWVGFDPFVPAE